jgi:hypothetical protein
VQSLSFFPPWALRGRHGDSDAKRFGGAAVTESLDGKRPAGSARRIGVPSDLNGERPLVLKSDWVESVDGSAAFGV